MCEHEGERGSKILQIDHSVRNNSELYLSFGDVDDQHPGDYEYWPAELSENDPLYAAKKSVLEAQGFADKGQTFPCTKIACRGSFCPICGSLA